MTSSTSPVMGPRHRIGRIALLTVLETTVLWSGLAGLAGALGWSPHPVPALHLPGAAVPYWSLAWGGAVATMAWTVSTRLCGALGEHPLRVVGLGVLVACTLVAGLGASPTAPAGIAGVAAAAVLVGELRAAAHRRLLRQLGLRLHAPRSWTHRLALAIPTALALALALRGGAAAACAYLTLVGVSSLVALELFTRDKLTASSSSGEASDSRARPRIAERTLHGIELLGGWPGALLAREALRHKSWKPSYRGATALRIALHGAVVSALALIIEKG